LDRVLDMGSLVKNYFSAQDRIRAGEIGNGLPANATPEQMTEWRKANDVPDVADKYNLALDQGLVLGDEDNRIMSKVYPMAHQHNVSNKAMSAIVNSFLAARAVEEEQISLNDNVDSQTTTAALKMAWKNDHPVNIQMISNLTALLPEAVRDPFMSARLPDGKAVFNSPEVLIWMADIARQLNPAGTVVPNANNPVQAIADEIASLETRMGADSAAWHKDTAAQQRYMSLINARERMKQ
jgi:hypothetical protein